MTPTVYGLIFFAIFILLVPVLRRWPSFWRWIRYPGSGSWPTVEATVKVRGVREDDGAKGEVYRPYITYTYMAEGQEHVGFFQGDIYASRLEAEAALDNTCAHRPVMVRVHPRRPKTSVLVVQ